MECKEERFAFGKNWKKFVHEKFSQERVDMAQERLLKTLRLENLHARTFLDIGCGSGIHSLAAWQAGASQVVSFDYDADSVETTRSVRKLAGNPENWVVLQGSVLDERFIRGIEPADVVYSWGVLHHTGDMWSAIRNASIPLKPDGVFFIALYSYTNYQNSQVQGHPSPEQWLEIKQRYNQASALGKVRMELLDVLRDTHAPVGANVSRKQRRRNKKPSFRRASRTAMRTARHILRATSEKIGTIRQYERSRGMSYWTDVRDWLGGWPMEFVKEDELIRFCREQLGLETLLVLTGEGNSEFVLRREGASNYWDEVISRRLSRKLEPPFEKGEGKIWSTSLPELANRADTIQTPLRSEVQLFENGTLLPFAHSPFVAIEHLGGGRYSHWEDRFYFSTSDNSDPNVNNRIYSLVYDS